MIDEPVEDGGEMDADEDDGEPRRFVVCGTNPLALRLVEELVDRYRADVAVLVPGAGDGLAPAIGRLAGVRLVEAGRLDPDALRRAGVPEAAAIALVDQDDAGNVDTALLVRELNPDVRIVVRVFNPVIGDGLQRLIDDCTVLSDAAMAAPAFVAALTDIPNFVALPSRTLFVVGRERVRPADVVCGLAVTGGRAEPETLPADEDRADVVLAISQPEAAQRPAALRPRRRFRTFLAAMWRRLRLALGGFAAMLAIAALTIFGLTALGWWQATYVTILSALAGANPDLQSPTSVQVVETLLTVASVAVIPVLTAAVVEAGVSARLALASDSPGGPVSGHVVVVGLGNVGTRVIRSLHELGVEVIAVDAGEQARGVAAARGLRIPLIIGDAKSEETLRAAYVQTCQAMLVLTTDDVTNLEAALIGRAARADLRVVLRLFDGDFAGRVQRAFGISSHSVSYLAAPAFAAAMLGRAVIDSIPVGRRVLLVADLPVGAGSDLEYRPVAAVSRPHQVRLLGIRTGRGDQVLWSPPPGRQLSRTDRLLVVATRSGPSAACWPGSPPATTPYARSSDAAAVSVGVTIVDGDRAGEGSPTLAER